MTRLLIEELENSRSLKLFHKAGRKPLALPKQSSTPDKIVDRCYAIEVRVIEGTDMTPLLDTPSVMKGIYGDSNRETVFSKVANQ